MTDCCYHVLFIFAKCNVRADGHGNAHCCGGSPPWCNGSTIFSSIGMKTILAEALTPVLAVGAKIPSVESLLLFPRRDGERLGVFWSKNEIVLS